MAKFISDEKVKKAIKAAWLKLGRKATWKQVSDEVGHKITGDYPTHQLVNGVKGRIWEHEWPTPKEKGSNAGAEFAAAFLTATGEEFTPPADKELADVIKEAGDNGGLPTPGQRYQPGDIHKDESKILTDREVIIRLNQSVDFEKLHDALGLQGRNTLERLLHTGVLVIHCGRFGLIDPCVV